MAKFSQAHACAIKKTHNEFVFYVLNRIEQMNYLFLRKDFGKLELSSRIEFTSKNEFSSKDVFVENYTKLQKVCIYPALRRVRV